MSVVQSLTSSPDELRLIVVENPYDFFRDPDVRAVWEKALLVKIAGYENAYDDGVLPCDTYDFVSTHHLIGTGTGPDFRPLMVYRMTNNQLCAHHRLVYPGVAVLRSSGERKQADILEDALKEWTSEGQTISYGSGWAILPEVRENPPLRRYLKDLMTAMLVHHEREIGSHRRLACGVLKVHTDDYFKNIGYRIFSGPEGEFTPFRQANLIGDQAILLHCTDFNLGAHALAKRHADVWQSREKLGGVRAPLKRAA